MYTLYEYPPSGNCYKLRLAMAQLDIDYRRVSVDITRGESRSGAFLMINPNGRIPVLQTPDGRHLPESNAALWFLAADSPLWPGSRFAQAQALQWMFFEQYSHEPYIATSRYWVTILKAEAQYAEQLAVNREKGYAALGVMESHLEENEFFVAGEYSIADIALFAYTHVAGEGGFDLTRYPAVGRWLARIASTPGFITLDA